MHPNDILGRIFRQLYHTQLSLGYDIKDNITFFSLNVKLCEEIL